jgi:hypothetical protein
MTNHRDPNAEQDWTAQERAELEERLGLGSTEVEPRVAQYRLIARVLSEPVDVPIPADFAAAVAARVETAAQPADDPFDRWFQRGLFPLLALAAIVFVTRALAAPTHAGDLRMVTAVQWAYAIGVCIALSLLIEIWTTSSARHEQPPTPQLRSH